VYNCLLPAYNTGPVGSAWRLIARTRVSDAAPDRDVSHGRFPHRRLPQTSHYAPQKSGYDHPKPVSWVMVRVWFGLGLVEFRVTVILALTQTPTLTTFSS
jgi:hypothetical protein